MNKQRNIIILVLIIIGIIGLSLYTNLNRNRSQPPQGIESGKNIYKSAAIKFAIEVPKDFKVEDKGVTLTLKHNLGELKISRNGTQYQTIKSHLGYFDKLRGVSEIESKELRINAYQAIRRLEETPDGNRLAYYIMVESFIYTLSTTSQPLFDDLDQIAKSFQSTP